MKKYNIQNYVRYKEDIKLSMPEGLFWDEYTRDQLVIKFMYLVENLARKFSTSQQASGVMTINDLIQEGSIGLISAIDKLNWETLKESEDIEKTLKSFLSKRIKGSIRRAIDINRGDMRIPEHKINEVRRNPKNEAIVSMFFNSIFNKLETGVNSDGENIYHQIEDNHPKYNLDILNAYLISIMKTHLDDTQFQVVRLFYGLDCDKMQASEIAKFLGIQVNTANVRISQIKKEAIDKLIANVSPSQVVDYL
jgi:RNA polymerase sigma factor (sigma-70 family)|tara:strand:+ start:185 stop:937 length:753 start_codon:yes stop_codon:yes gene_type:complete